MYLVPPSSAYRPRPGFSGMRRHRRMHGLGAAAGGSPGVPASSVIHGIATMGPGTPPVTSAWPVSVGVIRGPLTVQPIGPIVYTPPGEGTPATGASVAGTPVPANYPTSQIYVAPGGTFYEYNPGTNSWVNVGTPYNVGAAAPSTSTTPASTASVLGTPVPAGYPTTQSFTNTDGSIWAYSSTLGQWVQVSPPTSLLANSAGIVSAAGTAAPGVVVAPTDTYQSVLDWLSQNTLTGVVPNWVVALGAGFVALKLMGGKR
jgi:hypothetical protein